MDISGFDRESYSASIAARRIHEHEILYCCSFLPSTSSSDPRILAVGDSSGAVRLYSVDDITHKWLQQSIAVPLLRFSAHKGPVNCMALLHSGSKTFLLTGGEDCTLKAWDTSALVAACPPAASTDTSSGSTPVAPAWVFQPPHTASPLGMVPKAATVVMVAVDPTTSGVFIGCGDGGCHAVDLGQGAPAHVRSMPGHVAGVLGVDFCATTRQLASASEDSTVRLWDGRTGGCTRVINPWGGVDVADTPSSLLAQATDSNGAPPITAVRFDPSGSWLVASCGDLGLSCMSLLASGVFEQPNTSCTPQYLHIQPGEILAVGTEPQLSRYNFSFQPAKQHPLNTPSAFWIDVHPTDRLIAVCGARGCLDLLTQHGSLVGSTWEAPR